DLAGACGLLEGTAERENCPDLPAAARPSSDAFLATTLAAQMSVSAAARNAGAEDRRFRIMHTSPEGVEVWGGMSEDEGRQS
ncbi:MAG TPA: hypothetical protein VFJ02_06050, partial [Vicinamibacterales bacterium]|nr:hypothetical protein [Vicinamibacterales bacterium]